MKTNYNIQSDNKQVISFINSVIAQLSDMQCDCDSAILFMLECNYDLFIRCQQEILTTGLLIDTLKGPAKNPLIKVQTDAQIQCLKCLNDMMITPKQRTKMNAADTDTDSPLSQFFAKNK